MKPPYQLNEEIVALVAEVAEKLGRLKVKYLEKPEPKLRKKNRIRTIHASLQIEGNSLNEAQVTALLEDQRVIGPTQDILEVKNAIAAYDALPKYKSHSSTSFLKAHKLLMNGISGEAGKYRRSGVGIMAGKRLAHVAPSASRVPALMNELFHYVKTSKELALIKSCVFHYEMEFIHPFIDGNGRMGRLWQTLILKETYPLFEYLPLENTIKKHQKKYYAALASSDKKSESTSFITFMLQVISETLDESLSQRTVGITSEDRLLHFLQQTTSSFTRKDYLIHFPTLSTATASRDLQQAVALGLVSKQGEKAKTIYRRLK